METDKKADDLEKVLESIHKDNKQRDEIEDYKRRISALVDEAERVVGHRIESVVVTPQVYLMSRRQVKFNIVL